MHAPQTAPARLRSTNEAAGGTRRGGWIQSPPLMSATETRPLPGGEPAGPSASAGPTGVRAGVAAVIPARDEALTVGAVVYAALDARLVDEVVVVDNGSTDATAAVAAAHGARVVHEPRPGKGEALRAGVAATGADIVVFLDADLVGLRADHVDTLVEAVASGRADMACGLFDRGPVANPLFLGRLPVLTGQRALRRSLFDRLGPADVRGYRVEAALNTLVARHDLTRSDRVLDGLWHRTKEEKAPHPVVGFARKVAMLLEACGGYARSGLVRRAPAQPGTVPPLTPPSPQGASRGRS
jgi:hypothetical protein